MLRLIGRNDLVVVSAGLLVILDYLRLEPVIRALERSGLRLGLILMISAVLTPYVTGEAGWAALKSGLTHTRGWVAILVGIATAYLAAGGVRLLKLHPEVAVGLFLGSIAGTVLLHGVPTGPLVAAGLVALILRFL